LRIEKEESTEKKNQVQAPVPPLPSCTSYFGTHKKLPEPTTVPPS